VDPGHARVSVARQCALLGLARSSFYYEAAGETAQNLELMRLLDEQYTKVPCYGVLRMTECLRTQGREVNHKRVVRMMRCLGIEGLRPRRMRSRQAPLRPPQRTGQETTETLIASGT